MEDDNLPEGKCCRLIIDAVAGLTGEIGKAIMRHLDSEHSLILDVPTPLFYLSNIHSYFSN